MRRHLHLYKVVMRCAARERVRCPASGARGRRGACRRESHQCLTDPFGAPGGLLVAVGHEQRDQAALAAACRPAGAPRWRRRCRRAVSRPAQGSPTWTRSRCRGQAHDGAGARGGTTSLPGERRSGAGWPAEATDIVSGARSLAARSWPRHGTSRAPAGELPSAAGPTARCSACGGRRLRRRSPGPPRARCSGRPR